MPPRLIELRINSWKEIHDISELLTPYVFRGQCDADWALSTSLERCFKRFNPPLNIPHNREYWMLHEFKRKYHLYSSTSPSETDNFEWLAIMQHHGCPTRLLDFTYSIFLAAFFSVIDAETDSAIWAINQWDLKESLKKHFQLKFSPDTLRDGMNIHHIELANSFFGKRKTDHTFIIPAEPKSSQSASQGSRGCL
ncbi:FRG domain-containing protein [Trichlorobacter lovleyi]|uniref:FRG domain-containing protein n=1 Tax=Trichlorobacter lovleyi TaxID=313985 RepID=UPI002240DC4A|nr:FRG domain-containing protein [Trichlorobacter lovleyi]QOX79620.1 FRG domain-containing protein [Trichlorobacter lovleyi]